MKKISFQTKKKEPMIIAFVLFVTSIILGCLFCKITGGVSSNGMNDLKQEYFQKIQSADIDYFGFFRYVQYANFKNYFIFWMMTITILGLPYMGWCIVSHGFQVGFLFTVFTVNYGAKGFLLGASFYFPQILVYLPVMWFCLKSGYQLNAGIRENRITFSLHNNPLLISHIKTIFILATAMFAGGLLETFAGSFVVQNVLKLIS